VGQALPGVLAQGRATVVSVVTRGLSDDCTSIAVESGGLWLRVARLGPGVAFHVSADGARWLFVRHFALEGADGLLVGFEAQSPTGPGCAVTFTDMDFSDAPSAELRDGS
jgi:uncharacterized protein